MIPTLLRKLKDFAAKLVVRIILIALLAVLAIALAKVFGRLIPDGLDGLVGAGAVDRILSIIANSMLTVTTFSLTVMAATHRAVAGMWTPRAHQILRRDTTTHTVLATFVGAYLYAMIAIILRETQVFQGKELVVLFAMTLLVSALILVAMIRWIMHLEMFGSLDETARRIEDQASAAWKTRSEYPALGANPLADGDVPDDAVAIRAERSGYLRQIYQDRLQEAAEDADAHVWVMQPVGQFVYRGQVLAYTDKNDDSLCAAIQENAALGDQRNYIQDPEFGFLSLSEIASRALSPGINDPGTATDAVQRMTRVILLREGPLGCESDDVQHDRIWIAPLDVAAMVNRVFAPVLRDGADCVELQTVLRRSLKAVAAHPDPGLSTAASDLIDRSEAVCADTLSEQELAALRAV